MAINKDRFSRAIENLLSNATKFSRKDDTITISTRCSGGTVVISVADTGIGIPQELRDKIFEPFTKAGRAGTADEKSIGLGLSMEKKQCICMAGTSGSKARLEREARFSSSLQPINAALMQ